MGQASSVVNIIGLIASCVIVLYSIYLLRCSFNAIEYNFKTHGDKKVRPKSLFGLRDMVMFFISFIVMTTIFTGFEDLSPMASYLTNRMDKATSVVMIVGMGASLYCNVFHQEDANLIRFGDVGLVLSIFWIFNIASAKYITAFLGI